MTTSSNAADPNRVSERPPAQRRRPSPRPIRRAKARGKVREKERVMVETGWPLEKNNQCQIHLFIQVLILILGLKKTKCTKFK